MAFRDDEELVSRYLTNILRHAGEADHIRMRTDGYVPVQDVLALEFFVKRGFGEDQMLPHGCVGDKGVEIEMGNLGFSGSGRPGRSENSSKTWWGGAKPTTPIFLKASRPPGPPRPRKPKISHLNLDTFIADAPARKHMRGAATARSRDEHQATILLGDADRRDRAAHQVLSGPHNRWTE